MNAWGEVALERTMCSAVRRRMFENGMICSPALRNEAMEIGAALGVLTTDAVRGVVGGGGVGGVGGAAGGGGGAECLEFTTLRTSSLVIRPPTPVPVTSAALIPFSARSFRTTGERTRPSELSPVALGSSADAVAGGSTTSNSTGAVGG